MTGQLRPSESDLFWLGPSVPNPTTSQILTSQQNESMTDDSMVQIERACKLLRRSTTLTTLQSDSHEAILDLLWSTIYGIVTYDRHLRVDFSGFLDNVECIGKAQFVELVKDVVINDTWKDFLQNKAFFSQNPDTRGRILWSEIQSVNRQRLSTAYRHPFRGDAATKFIDHLSLTEDEVQLNDALPIYAKAIPVVQSSGTGKSRMLTEVGKKIFSLPICLRNKNDPGYPPSDVAVVDYFSNLPKHNDQSFTAHIGIACFLAAAQELMYEYLKRAQEKEENLLVYWNRIMEPEEARDERDKFFAQVVERAINLVSKNQHLRKDESPESKTRDANNYVIPSFAESCYNNIIKKPTEELMDFLSIVQGDSPCVTYFDEAHELRTSFWVLLRLVQSQKPDMRMWYVFMGTKSSFSYYSPSPSEVLSLKLKTELNRLLPPYIALGFDQHAIAESRKGKIKTVTMGELQSIEHLAQYGRPLWKAHLPEKSPGEIINLASSKLTNNEAFEAKDRNHVFAVLSQRFCLDVLMAGTEAVRLADHSVAHYMRLLTGFSPKLDIFHTHSPSEPILVLGAAHILNHSKAHGNRLRAALRTLCIDLCSAGLIEKGVMGELVARILLLVARDLAAPMGQHGPNLLTPVPVLDFLRTLFDNDKWAGNNQDAFNKAFKDAHINFTHWMMTKDPMPNVPDRDLLTNLWARGAALQCCFSQVAVDFFIPMYFGKMDASAEFDPSKISPLTGQVKFKTNGDSKAESAIRPIGIARDVEDPLPYLALLMELGNESNYQETGSKLKSKIPSPLIPGIFQCLTNGVAATQDWLTQHKNQGTMGAYDGITLNIPHLQEDVKGMQKEIDYYNRFSLSVRGSDSSVYGVLTRAGIVSEFQMLLKITMPPPKAQDEEIQHMRPCERLGSRILSEHNSWMLEYGPTEVNRNC